MRALIVAGGQAPSAFLVEKIWTEHHPDLVIAADAGAKVLIENHKPIHVALGDFDSLDGQVLKELQKDHEVKVLPREKNLTDSEAAFWQAKKLGATTMILLGATGTRLDHSLANLGLLLLGQREGIPVTLYDDHNEVFLVTSGQKIPKQEGVYLSFLPWGQEVKNFTIVGAKYPLSGHDLSLASTRTISNEFQDDVTTFFEEGQVLCILSRD